MPSPSPSPSRALAAAWLAAALLAAVLVAPSSVAPAGAGQAPDLTGSPADPPGPSTGLVDDLEPRFLAHRPTVGPTWVVDIGASSEAERLMLRTLQGVVNRTEARLYLTEPADAGDTRWLAEYEAQGLVTVAGHTDPAGALDRFAAEAAGYVLATEAEPWSINVAATIAAAEGAVVATPELVPALEGRGLSLIEDVRGRWADHAAAYLAADATWGPQLDSPTVAVLRPGNSSYDFAVQQGMAVLFTRPQHPSWGAMQPLLAAVPDGHVVYGYLSDTGEEEAVAVATLSANGNVLVPTDTTRNLSFHVAVGADQPRVRAAVPDVSGVAPCDADTLNVVVGVSDGDNLNVPLNHFARPENWGAPQRGTLPVGWSMGPSMAVLAPAAWDAYAREATAADELVGVIGWGYAAPIALPDPTTFYAETFALMDELGMTTFWSLGGGLEAPAAPGWSQLDTAAGTGVPTGVLVGYGSGTGVGTAFASPAGRPAFVSGTAYTQTPAQLAQQVTHLLTLPPDQRPLVSFLAATNWSNPVAALIDALAPFEAQGVRFLTPAEAAACMPDATPPEPPVVGPGTCLPGEPIVSTGISLVSDTARGEITRVVTPITFPTSATAPGTAGAGDVVEVEARVEIDLAGLAGDLLDDRVRPVVAGFGPDLADTAWLALGFDDLTVRLVPRAAPAPPATTRPTSAAATPVGTPTATSTGPGVVAAWDGGEVVVRLDPLTVDSRTPGAPFEVVVTFAVAAGSAPDAWHLEVAPGPLAFDLALTVGVLLGTTPIVGGVTAPWTCGAADTVLSTTAVAAAPATPPVAPPPTPAPAPTPTPTPAAPPPAAPRPTRATPTFTG